MGSAETAAACLARAHQIATDGCKDPDPEWQIARWRPASAEVARACFERGPGRETLIETAGPARSPARPRLIKKKSRAGAGPKS
jgi:hypothetical protein